MPPATLLARSHVTHSNERYKDSTLPVGAAEDALDCAAGRYLGGITAALASLDAAILVATRLTAASGLLAWPSWTKPIHRRTPGSLT